MLFWNTICTFLLQICLAFPFLQIYEGTPFSIFKTAYINFMKRLKKGLNSCFMQQFVSNTIDFTAFNMRRGKVTTKTSFRLFLSRYQKINECWKLKTLLRLTLLQKNIVKFAFFDNSEILHDFLTYKIFRVSPNFGKFPLIKDWSWERHANHCSSLYLWLPIFRRS